MEEPPAGERNGVWCSVSGKGGDLGILTPDFRRLAHDTWTFNSLVEKELELVRKVERYHVDTVGLDSILYQSCPR